MIQILRTSRIIIAGWLAVILAILTVSAVHAEHTRYWRESTFDEFERGTAKGIAMRSDGKIFLAPRFEPLADPDTAYLWSLLADNKGDVYAGGGSTAKVVKYDSVGKATTVFSSTELSAQALALDGHDNLYVGTSPDGKVYKITPSGEKKVFFDPKTKYIWALAVDSDGTVYVATGDTGTIFRVAPDGKSEVFYKSDQAHIRAIAFDREGNVLAGSEPDGRILRISKSPTSATPRLGFVLYETSKKEITSLVVDGAGNVYAAAIGDKSRTANSAFTETSEAALPILQPGAGRTGGNIGGITIGGVPQTGIPQQSANFPSTQILEGSAVYRLAPDGSPTQLWSSRDTLVYALGISSAGKLLMGTGNRGLVVELDANGLFTNLAKTESGQVTGLAQGPAGKILLCTANPGKIFSLGPEDVGEGTLESQPMDARYFSSWGRVEWWGDNSGLSASGRPHVEMYVRSGNTANPDNNWSTWSGPYTTSGQKTDAPSARFVQWKVVLRSGSPSPVISWLSLSYMPKNIAPQIDGIALQDPGVRIQGAGGGGGIGAGNGAAPVRLRQPETPGAGGLGGGFNTGNAGERGTRFESLPQGVAQKGFQSVVWSARDDNDDDLVYSIYYRGENEKQWKLLKDNLHEKYYSWDTTTMPDGAYYLKIVASDSPSNPPTEALETSRESDRFVVANAPPELAGLTAAAEGASGEAHVTFTAKDAASSIARAEYSVDAGDWTLVYPTGRLSDYREERYDLPLKGLSAGEHTIAVRVYDRFENIAAAKVTFKIPASR